MSREDTKDNRSIPSPSSSKDTLGVQGPSIPSPRKKPNRRATAVYPNVNSSNKTSKPFSRSAAKRGSVMALGSIEHLQYYFTKTGLAAKEKPQSTSILVPAIGGPQYIRTSPSGEVEPILDEEHFVLPPTPMVPRTSHQPPFMISGKRNYEVDPEQLKRNAVFNLRMVQEAWNLSLSGPNSNTRNGEAVDILSLLRCTTRAIRSVRNYVVSLPDDPTHPETLQHLFHRPIPKAEFRPSTLQPTLTKRTAYQTHSRKFSQDILYQIRQSALDVLSTLHALEEVTRLPLSDEAYDVQSDHGSASSQSLATSREHISFSSPRTGTFTDEDIELGSEADASFSFSVVKVPGRDEHIHVWTNEDDESLLDDTIGSSNKTGWDEKLVLGAGWLYRQDVKLGELEGEREVVGNYLSAIDNVLFGGSSVGGRRGWDSVKIKTDSGKRRSLGSAGVETPSETNRGRGAVLVSSPTSNGLSQALEDMRLDVDSPTPPRGLTAPASLGGMNDLHDLQEEDEEDSFDDEHREIPDSELPDWARRNPQLSSISNDPLARAHALLIHLLPTSLLHHLPLPESPLSSDEEDEKESEEDVLSPITPTQHNREPDTSSQPPRPTRNPARSASNFTHSISKPTSQTIPRIPFLQALSSGQLLCVAYNAALRRSRKPWGYINLENVHDVIGIEAEGMHDGKKHGRRDSKGSHGEEEGEGDGIKRKVGWTFRRTDNLRLWTAALRLRYQIPISSSPVINKSANDPPFLLFDARTVAKRENGSGWDMMLETVLLGWVEEVVKEKRGW